MENSKIALFKGKSVRRIFHDNEWLFSIIDVIEILTDSHTPRRYWTDMKRKIVRGGGLHSAVRKLRTAQIRINRWQKICYRLRQH